MGVRTALLVAGLWCSAPALGAPFSQARAAYDLNHVAEAETLYAAVIADPAASPVDKAASERELGRIAWLVDGDPARSLGHLDAALKLGDKPCDSADLKARFLRESGRLDEAIRTSAALLAACPDPALRDPIRTSLIGARLDLAARDPAKRDALIAAAKADALQFTPDADVEAARMRLETALLTDNAAATLAAWKDYFWLTESDAPQALEQAGVSAIFNRGLRSNATVDDRLKLAELLMRAGFSRPSQSFAARHGLAAASGGSPVWKRLDAYWREREKLEATLLGINRGLARGHGDQGRTEAAVKAFTSALMSAAGATGDPKAALRQYYGLVGTVGETNGYPSMHGGHVIEDHADRVTQYGKSAEIHFIAIDNMISNGFTSWLWDGSAAVGGWTADGVIVHIRPGYVQSPLGGFRLTQDSAARRQLIAREKQLASEDLAKLKTRPVATLDGLNARLQLQLVDRIAAVARTKSSDEASFRRAFLAEYSRANLDQSIRKHEGRHAIDEALGLKVEQAVLEYQAKLSELALTDYPRMALRNMDRSLEGDGPHDRAGARIFDQLRQWIERHPDQVMGYDPALPALVQLDKLSDNQISEIARALDPLAQGKPTPPKL
ncbi:MAG: hypothetical protein ABI626_05380 [Sphingomicrobium sp.]